MIARAKEAAVQFLAWTPLASLFTAASTTNWYEGSLKVFAFLSAIATAWGVSVLIGKGLWKNGSKIRRVINNLLSLEGWINELRRQVWAQDVILQSFQDASEVMTFRAGPDGQWTWTSDSLEKFMDGQPHELEGLNWYSKVDESERRSVSREWSSAVMERRIFDCNVELTNGRWLKIHAAPVPDPVDKHVICFAGHCRAEARPHGTVINQQPILDAADVEREP